VYYAPILYVLGTVFPDIVEFSSVSNFFKKYTALCKVMLYDQSLFASVLLLFDVKLLYIDPNC